MNFLSYIVAEISLTNNVERKKKMTHTRKNKQENAGSQSQDATNHCKFTYKILIFYFEQLLRFFFVVLTFIYNRHNLQYTQRPLKKQI